MQRDKDGMINGHLLLLDRYIHTYIRMGAEVNNAAYLHGLRVYHERTVLTQNGE